MEKLQRSLETFYMLHKADTCGLHTSDEIHQLESETNYKILLVKLIRHVSRFELLDISWIYWDGHQRRMEILKIASLFLLADRTLRCSNQRIDILKIEKEDDKLLVVTFYYPYKSRNSEPYIKFQHTSQFNGHREKDSHYRDMPLIHNEFSKACRRLS